MNTNLVSLVISREEARKQIQERIEKGEEIFKMPFILLKDDLGENEQIDFPAVFSDESEAIVNLFSKWSDCNKNLLNNIFNTTSIAKEYCKSRPVFTVTCRWSILESYQFIDKIKREAKGDILRLESLKECLNVFQEHSLKASSLELHQFGNDVFIVHGHDEAAKAAVSYLIASLGFKAVVLHEQANAGRTIIEKFEEHSDVGFAVVLLTPDDLGSKRGEESNLKSRARQNVIFELGYFIGKLGRQRVCALKKDDVEILSDFAGVLYVPMDDAGAWKTALAKEMKKAGLPVNAEKLLEI